jgi:hypothetical protein
LAKTIKQKETVRASRTGTTGAAASPAKAPAKPSTQTKAKSPALTLESDPDDERFSLLRRFMGAMGGITKVRNGGVSWEN